MIRRNLFFVAGICSIAIISNILTGCETLPEPEEVVVEAVEDDVWTLLARGETEKAKSYFLGQVDVNDTDSEGRTPLHIAAEMKDPVLASFFISLGAQIDALDRDERTPLAISAEKLDARTARVLVNANANIHHPMKGNTSPARIAVRDNGDFLTVLLSPSSVSAADSNGKTILHIAAEVGSPGAVDTILEMDKNVSKKDNNGKTALDIALQQRDSRNHAETAEHLILAGAVSDDPLYTYFAPAVKSSNYNIRSTDGMTPLHYIAREGYLGYLDFVLEKKVDVNIKNASGTTPLHEAARSGNVAFMETLLNNRAEINTQDAKGNSVLHIAIPVQTHLAALNLLLARGANLNLRDEHGDSPLHVAIILNRPVDIIQTLLSGGADISIRDIDGKTPLYLAVEKNRSNYIPLLLSYRSDIFAADNNGLTPFEKALKENSSMVFAMISKEAVFQSDSAGNTMLHITVRSGGNTDVLNAILDHNASINARNRVGDTSLTIAVRMNEKEAGELLINRGADIFAVNAEGESPLLLTFPSPGGQASDLRQWMLNPQTLSARDGLGNTALHYAAQWRFDQWIPILIQMDAKTEASNATGETPLFTAVKQDSPSTIMVLISNGAMLSARDTLGNSALHAAVRWHAIHGAETLIDLDLDINCHALNGKTPLHDSIRLGKPDFMMLLLNRRADIEVRDADGNTPFMEAIFAGNLEMMQQLAGRGADPNTRNFNGDTPLHITVAMERADLSSLLLGWGASIHARNAQGRTPYQNALTFSPRLIRTLLTRDRLYLSDDYGSSPLHIAVQERSSLSIIKMIIELGVRLSPVDAEGRIPARLAVDLDQWETAKFLADSGADVFITARDGKNAAEISLTPTQTAGCLLSEFSLHGRSAGKP